MTLTQIITEIWKNGGEPSDLDPSVTVSTTTLTQAANNAMKQICNYKLGNGNLIRFNQVRDSLFWSSYTTTGTISAVNNTTFPYYVDTDLGAGDDRYNEWILEITSGDADGDIKVIVDYTSTSGRTYYEDAFTTAPSAADTIKVYKRFSKLLGSSDAAVGDHIAKPSSANGGLIEVIKIEDVKEKRTLDRARRDESFPTFIVDSGDPSKWYRYGDRIYFDLNISTKRWFKMEYYRLPKELSSGSDVPEIDEQFHYAIVLWGLFWIFQWQNDLKSAWAAEQRFDKFMRSTITSWDVKSERENSYGFLRME